MIDSIGTVRGYANVFGEFSVPLDGDEPLRERIRSNAFMLLHHPVTANIQHCSAPVATTWDRGMRLWMDSHGLAVEIDVPCTPEGRGTRDLVASGNYSAMSFGLIEVKANYFRDEDGVLCREVTRCDLDHVSIVATDTGAYASACCWVAGMPSDLMPPRIRNASLRWRLGKIARDQKRAEDRALAARVLAAKTAPVRRGPVGKAEPILIDGLKPYEFLRRSGASYEWRIPEGF
jgi:HK97 family phage prohead protease